MPYDKNKIGRLLGISIVSLAVLFFVHCCLPGRPASTHRRRHRSRQLLSPLLLRSKAVSSVLPVKDNQVVHKNDVLFVIRRPFEYALTQAKADQATLEGQINDERRRIAAEQSAVGAARAGVTGSQSGISAAQGSYLAAKAAVEHATAAESSAEAQLHFAQNDYDRIAPLLAKHYVATQQVDQAQTVLRVAQEAYHQAESQTPAGAGSGIDGPLLQSKPQALALKHLNRSSARRSTP